ncbi:MAG: glycerol-3-phosphate dehydrogenase/oxidase [Rhodoferax sp.]|nr:glycerol-3-phosphate dehydrogenase/oxidase [Rhodoferax sp.]
MADPQQALPTVRADLTRRLAADVQYDIAIVGGGATGLGIALDAATRGLKVVLVESHDFAKGTSSRATKLLHGGVRYLAQGNIGLVREALHERTTVLRNAPHLAQPLAFVVPAHTWWEAPFYGIGLTMYDLLAGKAGLGKTEFLNPAETLKALPQANPDSLKGGVKYWDGQFNDARLAITLAKSAALAGALLVNYCKATNLTFDSGRVSGLVCEDTETGQSTTLRARCVINAAGVWVDALRQIDGDANANDGRRPTRPMVAPSQGVHLVVDRHFLGSDHALMVPKTSDGRVLFAVPWLGKVILGTTDTPRPDLAREPDAFKEEVDFILRESARYLRPAPTRADVKSIWVGLRPLVKPPDDKGENTKALSREHTILVSRSGLVTVTGGKWTTYRAMAEDVLRKCVDRKLLPSLKPVLTNTLRLVGAESRSAAMVSLAHAEGLHSYGIEALQVAQMPGADRELAPGLTEAMVRYAARHEYARTVEDVLARRSRMLFLDAALAASIARAVAEILASETGQDAGLDAFIALTTQYLEVPA